jgi:hypothetical protein
MDHVSGGMSGRTGPTWSAGQVKTAGTPARWLHLQKVMNGGLAMQEKTAPYGSGRLVRRLALSAALGATAYVALGITRPAVHWVAFVNEAKPGTTPDTTEDTTKPTEEHSHIAARARLSSSPVVAKHQDWTAVPLTGNTWTQPADAVQLVAGTVRLKIPAKCTGSFGNALTLAVDDAPLTFATAPNEPASKTVTMPFIVGTLSEPGQDTKHTLTAKFGSSCTQAGEDYTIEELKVDVISFA